MTFSILIINREDFPIFAGELSTTGKWSPIDARTELFLYSMLDFVGDRLERQQASPEADQFIPDVNEIFAHKTHAFVAVDGTIFLISVPLDLRLATDRIRLFFLALERLYTAEVVNPFYSSESNIMNDDFTGRLGREVKMGIFGYK